MLLFISETNYYFRTQRVDTIAIDSSKAKDLYVYFDIIFFNLQCSEAFIDVFDEESGVSMHSDTRNVKKIPVDKFGAPLHMFRNKGYEDGCYDCFFSIFKIYSQKCCSCNEVKKYYRKSEDYKFHPLCIKENLNITDLKSNEGCEVSGSIRIPKVKGNFHIAAGTKYINNRHTHSLNPDDTSKLKDNYRIQHIIKDLRFGDSFSGQINPLKTKALYKPGLLKHTYFIQVIPTRYEGGWIKKDSFQYTYTTHTEVVDTASDHWHLPGVYFRYDFSPMKAILSKRSNSLSSYFSRLFALIGGIWVVLEIILRFVLKVNKVVKKKRSE